MKKLLISTLLAGVASFGLTFAGAQAADITLHVFVGGNARPDLVTKLLSDFDAKNPGITSKIEVGGATSEQQSNYLNTVLSSQDDAIDVYLVDIVRTSENAAAGWSAPLNKYLGSDPKKFMSRYLAAYSNADVVDGKVIALPFFADAQFLYYRQDLLKKYGLTPPATWDEMIADGKKIEAGEKNPNLTTFSTAGAPIEGTVCTYLVPMWDAGSDLTVNGKLALDTAAAKKPFELFTQLKTEKAIPVNLAEIATDRIRTDFQAGNTVFAMLWVYAYNLFQTQQDSKVKGVVGVGTLPGFTAGKGYTCIGGWQVAVSSFSKHKAAAAKLAMFMASESSSKTLAVSGSLLPVFSTLYKDPDVVKANPWFAGALPVLLSSKARPVTPRYGEVSEALRTNMNAYLAGTKTADAALADMKAKLQPVFGQ
ncbi:MAG: ABC transporter substrate-binding protein [Hyphomicrobiales bacterium]|nr:ABC transporter substrate-binding protein [Hyphomicrobiales bacterium]MDE2113375.1 ABC transporter substrate-binding protein [Hyphomicrobiales bacterium]